MTMQMPLAPAVPAPPAPAPPTTPAAQAPPTDPPMSEEEKRNRAAAASGFSSLGGGMMKAGAEQGALAGDHFHTLFNTPHLSVNAGAPTTDISGALGRAPVGAAPMAPAAFAAAPPIAAPAAIQAAPPIAPPAPPQMVSDRRAKVGVRLAGRDVWSFLDALASTRRTNGGLLR